MYRSGVGDPVDARFEIRGVVQPVTAEIEG